MVGPPWLVQTDQESILLVLALAGPQEVGDWTPSFSSLLMPVRAPEWNLWGRHTQMLYLWEKLFLFPHETECNRIRPVGVVKIHQSSLLWGMVLAHGKEASYMPPCSSAASLSKPEKWFFGRCTLNFQVWAVFPSLCITELNRMRPPELGKLDQGSIPWGWHLPNTQNRGKIRPHSKVTQLNYYLSVCL